MSRLGGYFAGILRAEVPPENEHSLIKSLQELSQAGLTVVVHSDESWQTPGRARANVLEIVGQDRPGIVSQISHVLTRHGVNVEELDTECGSAAMSGETLFKAHARLSIPETCNLGALRQELEKIAADLIVEISLADVAAAPTQAQQS